MCAHRRVMGDARSKVGGPRGVMLLILKPFGSLRMSQWLQHSRSLRS